MKYPDGFFDQMKFPVEKFPKGTNLRNEFPILQTRDAFNIAYLHVDEAEVADFDRDKILRYVFYCYDQSIDWDLVTPEILDRKKESLKLAGFGTKDESLTEMIISNVIVQVNDMVIEFLKMQNNSNFRYKMMAMELMDQYNQAIMEPIDPSLDDDKRLKAANLKSKLMDDCEKYGEKVDALNIQFFGNLEEAAEIEIPEPISPQNLSSIKND